MAVSAAEPRLAAVVIGRNEARWIERCLRSVVAAAGDVPGTDIVMVDSCSTDDTVSRALQFPVRVVELRPEAPLSPALGRLVGQHLTRSRYILFVDGDTEIAPGWVTAALHHLDRHPAVGGVDGKLREVWYDGERELGSTPDVFAAADVATPVEALGGNAVYRREVLERVGSFNPFVVSYEEAELAARLRQVGSGVQRLPVRLGTHHTGLRGSLQELGRRYRDNLIKGYGQVLRLGLRQGTFLAHARSMRRYLEFQAAVALGALAGLVALITRDTRWVQVPAVLGFCLLASFMLRSRSVRKPLRQLADWAVWAPPMLRGFCERPRDPREVDPAAVVLRQREGAGNASAPDAPRLARGGA